MCGLILLSGPRSNDWISNCTKRLQHRGPDSLSILKEPDLAIGFQRLAVNGNNEQGHQPYENQGWMCVVNGEIYNYRELIKNHNLANSYCDTTVILPIYQQINSNVIDVLDGFYAAVLLNPSKSEAICLRDTMGKKPLFVGSSNGTVFITSELKALESIDWFEALPKGVSKVNLKSGSVTLVRQHMFFTCDKQLPQVIKGSVQKRLPPAGQPTAIFLSGGLDSSIIASISSRLRNDILYFTLGNTDGPDNLAAQAVASFLGLTNHIHVPLPTEAELPDLISKIVYATESYNPSIISNGLATYLLSKAARDAGVKVVLTGEGADELFGGYHQFTANAPWDDIRQKLLDDMTFTELRRLDMSCMANGVEPRCPFLDIEVIAVSEQLSYEQMYQRDLNKVKLRQSFEGYLPQDVVYRKKTSCDVGSGIRSMVVRHLKRDGKTEREALLKIWKRYFSFDPEDRYFHAYPVFDSVIDIRGETHR